LIEMLITVSMLAIMVGMAAPNVSRDISHSRVNSAAQIVAGDLQQALSLAGRQRRPVRVVVDGSAKEIQLIDRVSGQLISRRHLGDVSEFKLYSVAASPSTVDVLPHGVATAATIVTLSAGDYSRRVTMTRGGHVRVGP
jgi:type IV fimbrial biogenesis protein FimT